MKHKFLTVLLALVAALCLCFGLAACGETGGNSQGSENGSQGGTEQGGGSNKPGDGDLQTGAPVEGVWTGATGEYAQYTVTIDVDADGETARMIMLRNMEVEDSNFYAFYWVFTKGEDGIYTLESAENGNLSLQLNGTALEFKSAPPAGMEQYGTQTVIFPDHEDLPAAPNITGIKYAAPNQTVPDELFEITFGANPAIRYNKEKAATGVTAIDVGGYKVLSGTIDGNAITVIAYKEGTTYYAAINIEGDHNRNRFTLSDTEPKFVPGGGEEQLQGGGN